MQNNILDLSLEIPYLKRIFKIECKEDLKVANLIDALVNELDFPYTYIYADGFLNPNLSLKEQGIQTGDILYFI